MYCHLLKRRCRRCTSRATQILNLAAKQVIQPVAFKHMYTVESSNKPSQAGWRVNQRQRRFRSDFTAAQRDQTVAQQETRAKQAKVKPNYQWDD